MNARSSLCLVSLMVLAACGGVTAAGSADEGAEQEQLESTQAELASNAARLAGAYHAQLGFQEALPAISGLVLRSDGTFFADVETGVTCVRAPCPTQARLTGRFVATRSWLWLTSTDAGPANLTGLYRYELFAAKKLSLSRAGASWRQSLVPGPSYCAAPVDCGAQGLDKPRCPGRWTCGTEAAASACAFSCDEPGLTVWPSNAQKLVARNPGGGMAPPQAEGSNCAVGAATYTLHVASGRLDYEVCSFVNWETPMTLQTGSKQLGAADVAKVEAALRGVAISTSDLCGADKPFMTIEVTTPSGTRTFADSFYACMGQGPYVDGIDPVFITLRDVAR